MFRILNGCTVALFILLSGCISISPDTPPADQDSNQIWVEQQKLNSSITNWSLKGKIGVTSGRKGGSATINWSYLDQRQDIELYGPFGGGRVRITADQDSATLKDTKGNSIRGSSAQEVLFMRLGWQVPFEELIMWSRGLPDQHAFDIKIDEAGLLKSLKQDSWQVEYQEYRKVNEFILPRKLTITSLPGSIEIYDDDGNYIGDELRVKVILKRWWEVKTG